jgi:hypothetical protein
MACHAYLPVDLMINPELCPSIPRRRGRPGRAPRRHLRASRRRAAAVRVRSSPARSRRSRGRAPARRARHRSRSAGPPHDPASAARWTSAPTSAGSRRYAARCRPAMDGTMSSRSAKSRRRIVVIRSCRAAYSLLAEPFLVEPALVPRPTVPPRRWPAPARHRRRQRSSPRPARVARAVGSPPHLTAAAPRLARRSRAGARCPGTRREPRPALADRRRRVNRSARSPTLGADLVVGSLQDILGVERALTPNQLSGLVRSVNGFLPVPAGLGEGVGDEGAGLGVLVKERGMKCRVTTTTSDACSMPYVISYPSVALLGLARRFWEGIGMFDDSPAAGVVVGFVAVGLVGA